MFIMHLVVPLYYPIWQVGKIDKKFSVHVHVWRERGLPNVICQFAQCPNRTGIWVLLTSVFRILFCPLDGLIVVILVMNCGRGFSGSNLLIASILVACGVHFS